MYLKTKVAVICQSGDDPRVYRLALAATAGAWDAGAEVRVRLVGEVTPPEHAVSSPEWAEILCDSEGIPQATVDDLEWADVVLFGTTARDGTVLGSLKEFVDATIPLWKQGKLANKMYGLFTGAAVRRDETATRLLTLADVFDFWGGIVVTPDDVGPLRLPNDTGRRPSAGATTQTPTGAQLAAARDQGRRAAELAHRRLAARRTLADVA